MIVNNKIGITLSGGGFRGVAHLGVLQFVKELGIELDAVSGASAGALAGAFIAEGYSPQEILQFAKEERFFNYSDVSVRNGGLFDTAVFEKIIRKYIPHDSFEGLKTPLYVSVTDLTNAKSLVFNTGSLSFAVKSSCCFPFVFQLVPYEDAYLCDGGLLNNFPVEQVRASCNKTIGINVNSLDRHDGKLGYKEIIARIIRMTTSKVAVDSKADCDVYLQPDELNRYNTFDTKKIDEIYQFGYEYAQKFEKEFLTLKEIKE
ncbi:NTE family protein rssA [Sphingobacterium multivorum]|uniref:patatin-like phospholipase family protein n=1 Tax=Sphingobacterium multivorum TaxID=28454 RepID=UPI000E006637|nr:patatin-like phospholipase family protein [Sphingobacterium multivorum]QQT46639.1 patatin-like phospholipase family protein [Sphingobacterium multivorum]SUJ89309.1 NTE family protein rssA [Sphingobacterium multivorum]